MSPKLVLHYFPFPGRGESVRLACVIGKIPFTNKAIAFSDWPTIKPTMVAPSSLPVLEVDGQQIGQSVAMLRLVGKLTNLYPNDLVQAAQVDSIMDTMVECMRPIELSVRNAKKSLIGDEDWSKEEIMAIRNRFVEATEGGLPFFFGLLEKMVKENGSGWLVGDSLTIADLNFYALSSWLTSGMLDGVPTDSLDAYPLTKSIRTKIDEIPEVVAYRAKHTPPFGDFDYEP